MSSTPPLATKQSSPRAARVRFAAAALLLALATARAGAQASPRELRFEVQGAAPAIGVVTPYAVAEGHFATDGGPATETQYGLGTAIALAPRLTFNADARVVRVLNAPTEHRYVPALTARLFSIAGVDVRDRARVEIRDLGGAWSRRWQDRLTVSRPWRTPVGIFAPYAAGELSYDTRYRTINRREEHLGLRLPLGHRRVGVVADVYLMLRQDSRGKPHDYAALGTNAHLEF